MSVLSAAGLKGAGPALGKAVAAGALVLSGTAVGFIFEVFFRQRDVLISLAVLFVAGAVIALPLARRLRASPVLVLLALWALAAVPAFTLVPQFGFGEYFWTPWAPRRVPLFLGSGWHFALTDWRKGTDGPLNVLLFAPAALLLSLVTRHPARVVLGLAVLSLGIEVVQAWSGTRSGSPGDVGANVLGALLGAAAAAVLLMIRGLLRRRARRR